MPLAKVVYFQTVKAPTLSLRQTNWAENVSFIVAAHQLFVLNCTGKTSCGEKDVHNESQILVSYNNVNQSGAQNELKPISIRVNQLWFIITNSNKPR